MVKQEEVPLQPEETNPPLLAKRTSSLRSELYGSSCGGSILESDLSYEGKSLLMRLNLGMINKIFRKLREPLETDETRNIIDYNW